MSATVWIVIAVPLLLFAYLIGQAMPSPRDRQLSRLRTHARSLDLNVGVHAVADPDPDAGERVDGSGRVRDARLQVAGYTRALRLPAGVEKRHMPAFRLHWMRHHPDEVLEAGLPPGWRFERADLPLTPAVLERLSALLERTPRGTVSLEASATGVSLLWRERGTTEEVDAVGALLDDVRDLAQDLARDALAADRRRREVDDGHDAPAGPSGD
jgi:hypothetical protein